MKILMVCKGNICRSPLAEGILQHKAKQHNLNWFVDSAAIANYHIGKEPHHLSKEVAKKNGIDISKQKARMFQEADLEQFDIIYAMSVDIRTFIQSTYSGNSNIYKVKLIMDEMYPNLEVNVPDPFYGTIEDFHAVFNMLNECSDIITKSYMF